MSSHIVTQLKRAEAGVNPVKLAIKRFALRRDGVPVASMSRLVDFFADIRQRSGTDHPARTLDPMRAVRHGSHVLLRQSLPERGNVRIVCLTENGEHLMLERPISTRNFRKLSPINRGACEQ